MKLPKTFNCGFFLINISELKSDYLDTITEYLSRFDSAFIEKISKLLESTGEIYNILLQSIEQEPKTLEEYIEIKKYISSASFKDKKNQMNEDINALKNCIDSMEKFLINIEENLLQISLEAFTWPSKISRFKRMAKAKLNEMKPKFYKVLEERKTILKEKFIELKTESLKFENYYDFSQAFQICQIARDIVSGLKEISSNAVIINDQEKFLEFEISDFEEFEGCLTEFEKFHLLWDFAEKWKFVSTFELLIIILNLYNSIKPSKFLYFSNREAKTGIFWLLALLILQN